MFSKPNALTYKGYTTFVRYDSEDGSLYGKIEGIKSFVNFTYVEDDPRYESVVDAFHEAVDDYLIICEEEGIVPERPYSGKFNVRIPSELHAAASARASEECTTLNDIVNKAIYRYVVLGIREPNEKEHLIG